MLGVLAGAVLAGSMGCARMASVSTLDENGGIKREVVVTLTKTMGGDEKLDASKFITFPSPASWTVTPKDNPTDLVVTATRTLAPDPDARVDLVMADGGKGKAQCQVRAVKRADGAIEYTETWTWTGAQEGVVPRLLDKEGKELFAKALAPMEASEAQLELAAKAMERTVRKAMLGPGSPMLGDLLVNQNAGIRKLRAHLMKGMEEYLASQFPQKPADLRATVSREFAQKLGQEVTDRTQQTQESGPGQSSGQLVSIEASVAGLGAVVETNGEVDPVDGRVYWSMFLEACQSEPVVLRAVFRP